MLFLKRIFSLFTHVLLFPLALSEPFGQARVAGFTFGMYNAHLITLRNFNALHRC